VLVAVPDAAIEDVAEAAVARDACCASQVWLHVSGARPASALSPLQDKVLGVGAFHPAHVFSPNAITPLVDDLWFAVDGNDDVRKVASALAADLGGRVACVPPGQRPAYHAATVMASNCVAALISEARDLLCKGGLEPENAENLLVALARSATEHAGRVGLDKSLSGPIRRGDADAVSRHLEALVDAPRADAVYRLLGLSTAALAKRIGDTDDEALLRISQILESWEIQAGN
jgi:predicted short-subunit dehydrogenase-like oxidoreductase (DUF2520 family)